MKTNNILVDQKTLVNFLLGAFPLVASLWEAIDAAVEVASVSHISGTMIHIPLSGILLLLATLFLTIGQFALSSAIARKSGWSSHTVNSGLELVMLAFSVFT